ncbi:MAG: hypothetical protein JSS49_06945 [Planctomycetes bacterium]|nr:hypothetical protein [Planctomycetota bacterium]
MPISVVCEDCDKKYSVKDDMAGKKIRCKECQSILAVPVPEDDDPFEGVDLKSTGKTLPKRRRRIEDEDHDDSDVEDYDRPARRTTGTRSKSRSKRRPRGGGIPVPAIIVLAGQSLLLLFGGVNLLGVIVIPQAAGPTGAHHAGAIVGALMRLAITTTVLVGLIRRSQNARTWSRVLSVLGALAVGLAAFAKLATGGDLVEVVVFIGLLITYVTMIVCLSTGSAEDWYIE